MLVLPQGRRESNLGPATREGVGKSCAGRYVLFMLRMRRLPTLALLLAGSLAAQTPPPAPPAQDPALPDLLKELKSLVGDPKMQADFQAISLIQKLATDVDQRHPKDRERIAGSLGEVFRTGKLRPVEQPHLYEEATKALALFGEDGSKEISRVLGTPRFKDQVSLRCKLMLALADTQDTKHAGYLLDEAVRSHHDEIRAAAGEALGRYRDLELRTRRDIVKQLMRSWGSLHSAATQPIQNDPSAPIDPGPQNAQQTLRAVEGKWQATLSKLTQQSFSTFADWQRWLNKNPNWTLPGAPRGS